MTTTAMARPLMKDPSLREMNELFKSCGFPVVNPAQAASLVELEPKNRIIAKAINAAKRASTNRNSNDYVWLHTLFQRAGIGPLPQFDGYRTGTTLRAREPAAMFGSGKRESNEAPEGMADKHGGGDQSEQPHVFPEQIIVLHVKGKAPGEEADVKVRSSDLPALGAVLFGYLKHYLSEYEGRMVSIACDDHGNASFSLTVTGQQSPNVFLLSAECFFDLRASVVGFLSAREPNMPYQGWVHNFKLFADSVKTEAY